MARPNRQRPASLCEVQKPLLGYPATQREGATRQEGNLNPKGSRASGTRHHPLDRPVPARVGYCGAFLKWSRVAVLGRASPTRAPQGEAVVQPTAFLFLIYAADSSFF